MRNNNQLAISKNAADRSQADDDQHIIDHGDDPADAVAECVLNAVKSKHDVDKYADCSDCDSDAAREVTSCPMVGPTLSYLRTVTDCPNRLPSPEYFGSSFIIEKAGSGNQTPSIGCLDKDVIYFQPFIK